MKRVPRKFMIQVTKSNEEEKVTPVATLPEGKTQAELRNENPTLVYCNYAKCQWIKPIEGLSQTPKEVLGWLEREPWADDPNWKGVCSRGVIAISLKEITLGGGAKYKVPECFTNTTRPVGHRDFTKMLPQSYHIPDNTDPVHRRVWEE